MTSNVEVEDALVDQLQSLSTLPSPTDSEPASDGPTNSEEKRKKISSVSEFGTRELTDEGKVWDHNAWDNVAWGEEEEAEAQKAIAKQKAKPVPPEQREMYDREAARFWNEFYAKNDNKFFKDRHWLDIEFPEIFRDREPGQKINILEVGCGAGNTVFPLLEARKSENMFVYACDFSSTAIDVVKASPLYDTARCEAFVFDITSDNPPPNIPPNSIDVCTCIFVLSAINPSKWEAAVRNFASLLKPGGILLFRDYGRYDLTQLRLKGGRLLEDNFYIRGDGTRVYFFTQEEINGIFGERFKVLANDVDRRLLVNRARKVKMHRIWVQAKLELKEDGVAPQ